jgi:hypothetical protein
MQCPVRISPAGQNSLSRCIVHIKAIYLSIHQTAHHGVISTNPFRHAHPPLSVRFVVGGGRGGYNHYPPYRPPHVLNGNSRRAQMRTVVFGFPWSSPGG